MGFYFRKSIRVGPLRFNLFKADIDVSVELWATYCKARDIKPVAVLKEALR